MFYERYVQLCNSVGKTPSAVAIECGMTSAAVSRWKKGVEPSFKTVVKFAEYFNVPTSELTGEKMDAMDRILFILAKRQIPVPYMEAKLDFQPGFIDGLGKNPIPDEALEKIAEFLSCSTDFLLNGYEQKNKPDTINSVEPNAKYSILTEENRRLVDDLIEKLLISQSLG